MKNLFVIASEKNMEVKKLAEILIAAGCKLRQSNGTPVLFTADINSASSTQINIIEDERYDAVFRRMEANFKKTAATTSNSISSQCANCRRPMVNVELIDGISGLYCEGCKHVDYHPGLKTQKLNAAKPTTEDSKLLLNCRGDGICSAQPPSKIIT